MFFNISRESIPDLRTLLSKLKRLNPDQEDLLIDLSYLAADAALRYCTHMLTNDASINNLATHDPYAVVASPNRLFYLPFHRKNLARPQASLPIDGLTSPPPGQTA